MLYTITIIRLNAETKVFENTEHHGVVLVGDLEAEFERRKIPFEHLDLVLSMKGGQKL